MCAVFFPTAGSLQRNASAEDDLALGVEGKHLFIVWATRLIIPPKKQHVK